jgi:cytochrome c peroxidase
MIVQPLRPPRGLTTAFALLVGCVTPTTTNVDAATPADGGPRDATTAPDAFANDAATVDAHVADTGIDATVVPDDAGTDAFVETDAGPDAWMRPPPEFTTAERAVIATLTPLPALRPDPTNAVADDPAAAALGHALFFDPRYSGPIVAASDLGAVGERGRVSCASCHGSPVMSDDRSEPPNVSLGTNFHTRNAPAIVNSAFYQWTNWGGRFSAQWELPPAVAESGLTMNSTRLEVAHHIFTNYRTEYEAVFGAMDPAIGTDTARFPLVGKPGNPAWDGMAPADQAIVNRILVNFGMALQAYVRQLVSRDSDFDRFVAGDATAIGVDAQWGLRVFMGEGRCVSCHSGPTFADDQFHNLWVPQTGDHVPAIDDGRFTNIPQLLASPLNAAGVYSADRIAGAALLSGLTNPPPESTRGQFRTPTLRDLVFSGPYMHSGQFATLEDVITFYDAGGGTTPVSGARDHLLLPLGLDAQDRADLLAFLMSLTSDPVPAALRMAP